MNIRCGFAGQPDRDCTQDRAGGSVLAGADGRKGSFAWGALEKAPREEWCYLVLVGGIGISFSMIQSPMCLPSEPQRIGLLLSGGLDSCILLGTLLKRGHQVLPIYVESGLIWQEAELSSLRRFLGALDNSAIDPLSVLEMPVHDIYEGHWSLTGTGVPDAASSDQSVYLPARNALLLVKASVCCRAHEVEHLAIGVLGTSPFADAGADFFAQFTKAMSMSLDAPIRVHRPFAEVSKREVMELGHDLPLEWTFSCLSPRQQLHCGQCNKCAERRLAFREMGRQDRTPYDSTAVEQGDC